MKQASSRLSISSTLGTTAPCRECSTMKSGPGSSVLRGRHTISPPLRLSSSVDILQSRREPLHHHSPTARPRIRANHDPSHLRMRRQPTQGTEHSPKVQGILLGPSRAINRALHRHPNGPHSAQSKTAPRSQIRLHGRRRQAGKPRDHDTPPAVTTVLTPSLPTSRTATMAPPSS